MSRSFEVRYGPDDEDVYAAARQYFDQLPVQDQEAWDSLGRVSAHGARFKSAAHQLALKLGAAPASVELVEAEAGPEGPRYTVVARLSEDSGQDLLFRGQVLERSGPQTVVLDASLDYDELGTAMVIWGEGGAHGWLEILPDGRHEPGLEALSEAYRRLGGVETALSGAEALDGAAPALSPLEAPLSAAERYELPSVDELESWPVLGESAAAPRDFDWDD